MPVRVQFAREPYPNVWVEFRDEPWPFRDRRLITESMDDVVTLSIVLPYITGWNLVDVEGNPVPVTIDPKGLDAVDDRYIIPWLIRSWFTARADRNVLPKGSGGTSGSS